MKLFCSINRSGKGAAPLPGLPYLPAGQEIMVDSSAPHIPYEVYVVHVDGSGMTIVDPSSFVGPEAMKQPSFVLICTPDESNPTVIKRVMYVSLLTGVSLDRYQDSSNKWWRTISIMHMFLIGQEAAPSYYVNTDDYAWNISAQEQDLLASELLFRPAYDVNTPGLHESDVNSPLTKLSWAVNSDTSELIRTSYREAGTPFVDYGFPYAKIDGASLTMTYQNYYIGLFPLGTVSIGDPAREIAASFGSVVGICPKQEGGHDMIWVGLRKEANSMVVKGILHRSNDPGSHSLVIEGNPSMIYAGPYYRKAYHP